MLGDAVDVRYVWNIMEFGYRSEDILWLVESGVLTLGYQSTSYLTDRVPDIGLLDLPFLFATREAARAVPDKLIRGSAEAHALEQAQRVVALAVGGEPARRRRQRDGEEKHEEPTDPDHGSRCPTSRWNPGSRGPQVIQSADCFVDAQGVMYPTDNNAGLYILQFEGA